MKGKGKWSDSQWVCNDGGWRLSTRILTRASTRQLYYVSIEVMKRNQNYSGNRWPHQNPDRNTLLGQRKFQITECSPKATH